MSSNILKNKKGFTLIELVVVMTIILTITTAVVLQQNSWNDRLAVNTQAYDMALMTRQAQIYSLGVREYKGGTGDLFDVGYGICFDSNISSSYNFFVDTNKDQKCSSSEYLETKTLNRGVVIDRICGFNSSGQQRCSPDAGNLVKVNVSFLRPDPVAFIKFINNGGNDSNNIYGPVSIYLRSPSGVQYQLKVDSNGQISVI